LWVNNGIFKEVVLMQKWNYFKVFLMMNMFLFLIITGGCGGGGGGKDYPYSPPPLPGNPTLLSLQLSSGSLHPAFSPINTQYTASVAETVTSITVTPTTVSTNTLISVNGLNVASGNASGAVNLVTGSNTITIIVGNSNGSTTYTVTVTRASQLGYKKITAQEAHAMMIQSSNYILLDVRTEDEYKEERIEGAKLIPYDEIKNRAAAELSNKNQLIFIYCRSGVRSEIAARALVELGYSNVYDFGGILDWPYGTIGDPIPYWIDVADTSWWSATSSSFPISTPYELAGIARLVNQGITNFSGITITLVNNIDLAGMMWEQITGSYFQGVFDGGGHAISNMKIFCHMQEIGLFGGLGTTGVIKNVNLTNVDIEICPT